jgi:hypothetical protein
MRDGERAAAGRGEAERERQDSQQDERADKGTCGEEE